jgi:hypothetical protein
MRRIYRCHRIMRRTVRNRRCACHAAGSALHDHGRRWLRRMRRMHSNASAMVTAHAARECGGHGACAARHGACCARCGRMQRTRALCIDAYSSIHTCTGVVARAADAHRSPRPRVVTTCHGPRARTTFPTVRAKRAHTDHMITCARNIANNSIVCGITLERFSHHMIHNKKLRRLDQLPKCYLLRKYIHIDSALL